MSVMAMPMSMPTTRTLRPGTSEPAVPPVLRGLVVSAAALLATLLMGRFALHRFDAPVRELAISGTLHHIKPDEVRLAAAPVLDANLFQLDLAAVREAISRLPWVAEVRVDREWPARLAVRITEREPFARWGETDALSTEGIVFAPGAEALPTGLPRLHGAPGRERDVMAMYGQVVDRLSETPLALAGLEQDARGEWTGTTQSGITLRFGRRSPLEQIASLRGTVLPALSTRLDAVQSIDLRYANGFAVAWRTPPPAIAGAAKPESPTAAAPAVTPVAGVHP